MTRFQISNVRFQASGRAAYPRAVFMFAALTVVFVLGFVLISGAPNLNPFCIAFWLTPDQQGDRMMRRGEYAEAAKRYRDPLRTGIALYRAGEFKKAISAFGSLKTSEGHFNRGNALVMQGKYTEALEAYDSALAGRPGWREAKTNHEIARVRAEKLKKEGGDMTGGMLAADEIVFTSDKKDSAGQEQTLEGGDQLSDQALQAIWLRRIQTKPADFLKAKFAYQLSREGGK